MENSLLVIFDEIWPITLYYSTGTSARFWSNFKKSRTSSKSIHNIRKCNKTHSSLHACIIIYCTSYASQKYFQSL